ncbi:Putative ABC transporter（ABC transporter, substrate-binding protein,45-321&|uniref:ABC transporter substrate-binding protein n=1 Tax=Magnetospirillum sp. XM-1 TaxID=1663591 RepID=UPI00073DD3E4|nr:ABC transporter substrate-binding protein [Magnetospirillum sp. XM-1]CUW39047.1 Putative ABC transporter\
MRFRWIATAAGGVVLAAVFMLLNWGGVFDDRRLVIGVLNHAIVAEEALDGFKAGLASQGYPEGGRVTYHYRGPVTGPALEAEAERLATLKPDLFLSLSTPAAKAAFAVAKPLGTPLVFAPASDPIAIGLAETLGRPGRNATGVTFGIQEPVRLQWLKTLLPGLKAVLVPYNPDDASPRVSLAKITPLAAELGIRIDQAHVRNLAELDGALARMAPDVGAVFVPVDAFVASQVPRLMLATLGRGIPLTTPQRGGVVEGAFMSYGLDMRSLGGQGARLAAQILGGVPAGDLPVETAEFRLVINMETAGRLGLQIPDTILRQAELIRAVRGDDGR